MKQFLRKTFLVLLGGLFLNVAAWGTSIGQIGDQSNGDSDNGRWFLSGNITSPYTLAVNKTITFTFTVNSAGSDNYHGYVGILRPTTSDAFADFFVFLRAQCDYNSKNAWNTGAIYNANNYPVANPANVDTDLATKKNHMVGATVVMEMKRIKKLAIITTTITKGETIYTHYYVQDLGTEDDVQALIAADHAVLNITGDAITDSEALPTTEGSLVGDAHNGNAFWTAFSDYYTIAPEKSMKLKFKNYTNKLFNYGNFVAYVTTDADRAAGGYIEYLGLRADNWVNVANANSTSNNYEAGFNWNWNSFRDKMDGATILLTITRSGANVTVRADITPSDGGTPFYEEYAKECGDGAQNIRFFLTVDGSHIDILPETATISDVAWSTFASDYNLDFSQAESGLTAYTVTGHSGTAITKEAVTGIVPAGTPLLLNGTASTSYTIPVATTAGTAPAGNKLVRGADAAVSATLGNTTYVLSKDGTKAVFKKIESTSATVAKNQAYLLFNEVIAARSIDIDGDGTTGIQNLKVGKEDNVYYDLQGRRVLYPKKGLYIVNGKKVIINK